MINTILYYPFISVCAESIPQHKLEVRSAILSPHRAEFSAIISHKTYNMDNYFTEKVFNQKSQGYKLTKFYNKTKQKGMKWKKSILN